MSIFSAPKVYGSVSFLHNHHSKPLQKHMQMHLSLRRKNENSQRCHASKYNDTHAVSLARDVEDIIYRAVSLNFFERLNLAWNVLFPRRPKKSSNAEIAKKRLKMILFSDRCEMTDEAKQKIVNNIVGALSDFVEIESEDKVQLDVSADPDLGTVYSVSVPVRRVKTDYQDYSRYGEDGEDLGYSGRISQPDSFAVKENQSSSMNDTA